MSILIQQIHEHTAKLPTNLQTKVLDYILSLEQKSDLDNFNERKKSFSLALEQAAELNPFSDIIDPVAWQREQREDRSLLNREENVN